jgi:hypothetical protein
VKSALSTFFFAILFVAYLFIEVLAAMAAYMYLNLSHTDTFGYLVGLAQQVLSVFTTYFVQLYPELANHAFATILGEMGPKSILLLIMGLVVSAIARLLIWTIAKSFEGARAVKRMRSKAAA